MKMKGILWKECEVHFDADYRPARPAPACQDHDSPRFSDPGDDEECEFKAYFVIRSKGDVRRIEVPDGLIFEEVFEECRKQYENQREDLIFE